MTKVAALWSDNALALGSRSTGLGKMVQEPRAGFKVAEWRIFCHSAWLQISPARFKQVYSDSASDSPISTSTRRNFTTISWGLGLLMAIYGPPFPNYRSGPIQRERITAALLACSFASE